MKKQHLEHPTQSTACGTAARGSFGLPRSAFKTLVEDWRCRTCAKVMAALEAGRPVYGGYEDPETGDRGARVTS